MKHVPKDHEKLVMPHFPLPPPKKKKKYNSKCPLLIIFLVDFEILKFPVSNLPSSHEDDAFNF